MKKIFSTIAVASALFAGYTTYNAQHNTELTDIALANVEALATDASDNTSGNERPRYINKTRIKSREEIRTETWREGRSKAHGDTGHPQETSAADTLILDF